MKCVHICRPLHVARCVRSLTPMIESGFEWLKLLRYCCRPNSSHWCGTLTVKVVCKQLPATSSRFCLTSRSHCMFTICIVSHTCRCFVQLPRAIFSAACAKAVVKVYGRGCQSSSGVVDAADRLDRLRLASDAVDVWSGPVQC